MKEGALFIDRDGVICHMVNYGGNWDSPQTVEDVRLVSGIENVILAAISNGWQTIEIQNQPGVAKGKQTQEFSDAIESNVHELLRKLAAMLKQHIFATTILRELYRSLQLKVIAESLSQVCC